MLALIASPLARLVGGALVIIAFLWGVYIKGKRDGAANVRAEIAAENARRLKDATIADDAVRRCAFDPTCRLQDDGFRRD